ncbi:spore germination protein [Lentibacillus halodurans]|uniref:Spore germination protein n=1 Tax=Lentibacillus halodurans TaxID=237679 RepID=A0A1I0WAC6_9BACI|nr:Ger(x)C family spore germination protein [Lentibacillus halodurans]SFA85544.1 spore germination protein [Lentibacillus halodurans]
MVLLKYILFFVFVISSLLFNFTMPTKVIDQIQMITVVGYDPAERDHIRGTVVTPVFLQPGEVEDFIYTDTAATVYENRVQLNAKATEQLLNGKIKAAFYNQELAEQGIENFIEYLSRDPSIGGAVYLAVTEGSALELINTAQSSKGRGIYFNDLINHNIQHGNLPHINLKEFESSLQSDTCDPFLPMFGLSGGRVELQSIAFFDDDQYVDKLPIENADIFKILYQNVNDGQYQYKNDTYNVSVENIESAKNVKVDQKNGNPEVRINVRFRGVIREFTGERATDRKAEIERVIEQDFKQKAEDLINRFQELDIDPLDIEGHVKSSNRNYDKEQFKAAYPEMSINVNTNVKLTETGTRR